MSAKKAVVNQLQGEKLILCAYEVARVVSGSKSQSIGRTIFHRKSPADSVILLMRLVKTRQRPILTLYKSSRETVSPRSIPLTTYDLPFRFLKNNDWSIFILPPIVLLLT